MGNYIMWVKNPFVQNKLKATFPVFALYPERAQEIPLGHKALCLLLGSPTQGLGTPSVQQRVLTP